MAEPSVKRQFIDGPKGQALNIDRVPGGRAVVDATSDDPAKRFGFVNADIEVSGDIDRKVIPVLRASETFASAETAARGIGLVAESAVVRLPPETGGASTETVSLPNGRVVQLIKVWPPDIKDGFNVIDVVLHEHGHVFFDQGRALASKPLAGPRPDILLFVNAVQKELGIRLTPDSHI